MSFVIKTKNTSSTVAAEAAAKFSALVRETQKADATSVEVDIPDSHLGFITEYIKHHAIAEGPCPSPPLSLSWSLDKCFEDKWDSAFFARVIIAEKDAYLQAFIRSIEELKMDSLLRKVTLVVALSLTNKVGLDGDKIIEELKSLKL